MTRCASSSLSCWVSVRCVTPAKARCSSLNRLVPPSSSRRIRTFQSPPMMASVVSTGQLTNFFDMGEAGILKDTELQQSAYLSSSSYAQKKDNRQARNCPYKTGAGTRARRTEEGEGHDDSP